MPLALLALTISAFALGTTEFAVVGLIPTVADTLHASLLASLYALAVGVGAPLSIHIPLVLRHGCSQRSISRRQPFQGASS